MPGGQAVVPATYTSAGTRTILKVEGGLGAEVVVVEVVQASTMAVSPPGPSMR